MTALVLSTQAAAADEVSILAFGDSLVHGFGLPSEQGFVPVLQHWLKQSGEEISLINGGVSGDTTAGGLARIEWSLTEDVDALIVVLGGNDVLRGLPPEAARQNLAGILGIARDRGLPVLLAGVPVPGNFGPIYKQEFEAIYPELSTEFETLLYPDFLQPITQAGTETALAEYLQPDGIHPNGKGVERIVDDMGPIVIELAERAR